jgi:hypothetical protein
MIEVIIALGASLYALSGLPGALAAEQVNIATEQVKDTKANCTTNEDGKEVCGTESKPGTLPTPAKVAIALVVLTVVFLLLATVIFIRRSRKAAADAAHDVAIEESQMTGPPAILGATYTPGTGHSRVYSIGPDTGGFSAVPVTPQHRAAPNTSLIPPTPSDGGRTPASPERPQTPAFPSPSVLERSASFCRFPSAPTGEVPRSAPAHKASFSEGGYPFVGFGNSNPARGPSTGSAQQPRSAFVSSGGFPRPLLAGRLKDRIRERPPSQSPTLNSPK